MIIEINEIIMNCLGEYGQANSNKDDIYRTIIAELAAAFSQKALHSYQCAASCY